MSGTERAFSTEIRSSSTLLRIFSNSSSLTSSDGSRSHRLTSALEHSRIFELPEMAVGGTEGVSKSCREGVSCAPSSGSWPDISDEGRGCGDSGKMFSSSSGSWHIGLCAARTYSSLSFSFRRLAISACKAALSSSSLSVSYKNWVKKKKKSIIEMYMVTFKISICNTVAFQLTACKVSVSSLRLFLHFAAAILFLSLLILFFSSSSGVSCSAGKTDCKWLPWWI